jgi:hypothetical protein
MDQAPLYNAIQAGDPSISPPVGPGGPRGDNNWTTWNQAPPYMKCPSDESAGLQIQAHSYVVSVGDQVANVNTSTNTRGLFARINWRGHRDMLDGSSNTIVMSEIVSHVPSFGGQSGVAAGPQEWQIRKASANFVPGLVASPAVCRTVSDGRFYLAGTNVRGRRGIKWTDAPATLIAFNTVLPPNSPACSESGDFGDQDNSVLPPQSRHVGGVHGLFGDGAVHFISDSIDSGNTAVQQPATGPSRYGVWGAMGSIGGEDIVSEF